MYTDNEVKKLLAKAKEGRASKGDLRKLREAFFTALKTVHSALKLRTK